MIAKQQRVKVGWSGLIIIYAVEADSEHVHVDCKFLLLAGADYEACWVW